MRRKSGAYAVLGFEIYEDLLVEITGRGETVSTLPNAGVIFYPSVSAGHKLTDLLASESINFFKLRASYGEVGIGKTNPMLLQPYLYLVELDQAGVMDLMEELQDL